MQSIFLRDLRDKFLDHDQVNLKKDIAARIVIRTSSQATKLKQSNQVQWLLWLETLGQQRSTFNSKKITYRFNKPYYVLTTSTQISSRRDIESFSKIFWTWKYIRIKLRAWHKYEPDAVVRKNLPTFKFAKDGSIIFLVRMTQREKSLSEIEKGVFVAQVNFRLDPNVEPRGTNGMLMRFVYMSKFMLSPDRYLLETEKFLNDIDILEEQKRRLKGSATIKKRRRGKISQEIIWTKMRAQSYRPLNYQSFEDRAKEEE